MRLGWVGVKMRRWPEKEAVITLSLPDGSLSMLQQRREEERAFGRLVGFVRPPLFGVEEGHGDEDGMKDAAREKVQMTRDKRGKGEGRLCRRQLKVGDTWTTMLR